MNTYRNSILSPLKQEKTFKIVYISRIKQIFSARIQSIAKLDCALTDQNRHCLPFPISFIVIFVTLLRFVVFVLSCLFSFVCFCLDLYLFFFFHQRVFTQATYYTNENVNFSFSFICSLIYYDEWTLSLRQNNMSSGVRVFWINFVLNRLQSRTGNFNISISIEKKTDAQMNGCLYVCDPVS